MHLWMWRNQFVCYIWEWQVVETDTHGSVNTLRPRQNGRHFADDSFKRIFLNENIVIAMKISLKFVPKRLINNIPALVQIMDWRRPGDKTLSEPMMVRLPTHICVTWPQRIKRSILLLIMLNVDWLIYIWMLVPSSTIMTAPVFVLMYVPLSSFMFVKRTVKVITPWVWIKWFTCLIQLLFISAEMYSLQKEGFGRLLNKELHQEIKKEIFAKPHPDSLREDDPVLQLARLTLAEYRQKFNTVKGVSLRAAQLLLKYHPQPQLMANMFRDRCSQSEFQDLFQ